MKRDEPDQLAACPLPSPGLMDAVSFYEAICNRGFTTKRAFRSAAQLLATEESLTAARAETLLRTEIEKRMRHRHRQAEPHTPSTQGDE